MEVEAVVRGLGEGVGHHHHRRAVATAHIGDRSAGPELVGHAVERADPVRQLGPVARPEEPLGAVEEAPMVITPAHRAVTAERRGDLVHVDEQGGERVHPPGHEGRRPVVGQGEGALEGELVLVAPGLAVDQPCGHLAVEPLPHEAGVAARLAGDLVGRHRPAGGHRPVQAELVAQPDREAHRSAGHVHPQGAHVGAQALLVDGGHGTFLPLVGHRDRPTGSSRRYSRLRRSSVPTGTPQYPHLDAPVPDGG